MENNYFVLHKKDLQGQTLKTNKAKRELYDKCSEFGTLEEATKFALGKLHEQPILAESVLSPGALEKQNDPSYVIAALFNNKYHYFYYDECDAVPTHEIERCKKDALESTVRKLAEEGPNKMYVGVELPIFPSGNLASTLPNIIGGDKNAY